MTGFEDTLTEILTDEAARHRPPTFNAYTIADGAGRVRRRSMFTLAAGVTAVAALSAGAVYGLGGGSGSSSSATATATSVNATPSGSVTIVGPMASIIFKRSGSHPSEADKTAMVQILAGRANAAGIQSVAVAVSADGQTYTLSVPIAHKAQLQTLAVPGVLTVRPVLDPSKVGLQSAVPSPADCAKPQTGEVESHLSDNRWEFVCGLNHAPTLLVGPAAVDGNEVTDAVARQSVTSQGIKTDLWEVDVTLNKKGTRAFADLTGSAAQNGSQIAIVLDKVCYSAATVIQPVTNGRLLITGDFTEETAKTLAGVIKSGPLPGDLSVANTQK